MNGVLDNERVRWIEAQIAERLGFDVHENRTVLLWVFSSLAVLALTHLIWSRLSLTRSAGRGLAFALPVPEAARPHWKGKRVDVMSIQDPEQPDVIRCLCPATGQLLGHAKAATASEIDERVKRAHAAFNGEKWKSSTTRDRAKVLKTMLRFISEHQQEVCQVACRDTGKTMIDASLGEVMVTLEKIAWIIANGDDALAPSQRPGSASWIMRYKHAEVRYAPLGVVCAMVSWNYPLHNLMGPIAAALFAGDAIVVKCSEQVVWSSEYFVQIAKRALDMHGFDPDLVQLVACWPAHADALTTHPLVKHITFIGSRPVAHHVVAAAAKPLTPVVVELGGKDPLIVLEDYTKVSAVASIIMRGVFQSAGQNCIGVERVILSDRVHDALVETLAARVKVLRVGSSIDEVATVDMGALISVPQLEKLESLVAEAVSQGARLVSGGKRYVHPKYPLGIYFEPTMLTHVTPDMTIAQEEVFGPVMLVMKPTSSTDESIALANSTEFGLGASVFGKSKTVLNYVADELRCGNVALNDFATYHLCQLPFGGVDGSGYGKFGGYEGLRGLCLEKSVCSDRFPFISTQIPGVLDYPIQSASRAWGLVRSINDLAYATSWWGRFKGLRRSISVSLKSVRTERTDSE